MTGAGMTPRRILAVVGPGDGAALEEIAAAERIAELAARAGWIVSCGGRNSGVMAAAARGAARGGGVSIGILPSSDSSDAAPELTVALATGLGEARDAVVASSGEVLVACGMSAGTAAEVALAIKAGRPVVLIRPERTSREFFRGLGGDRVRIAASADEALAYISAPFPWPP